MVTLKNLFFSERHHCTLPGVPERLLPDRVDAAGGVGGGAGQVHQKLITLTSFYYPLQMHKNTRNDSTQLSHN